MTTETLTVEAVAERHENRDHARNQLDLRGRTPQSWEDCTTAYCIEARRVLLGERICPTCLQVKHDD